MKCHFCQSKCIKKGFVSKVQRYYCKRCRHYQQQAYKKHRIEEDKYRWVLKLNNEGCGISSISRLLEISKSSVQRLIVRIASTLQLPVYEEEGQSYEMDELRTYCSNKKEECWLMYGINKQTGKVIEFKVGRRTKENIKEVINTILNLNPNKIYTDGLNIYPTLIPKAIHRVFEYCTNKIERHNLTLRAHLKRLNRKTICFSRSESMLESCTKLYWFG